MIPNRCPNCNADFDAGPIPDEHKSSYEGDRFSRVISVSSYWTDRHHYWKCPDCDFEFNNQGNAINDDERIRES